MEEAELDLLKVKSPMHFYDTCNKSYLKKGGGGGGGGNYLRGIGCLNFYEIGNSLEIFLWFLNVWYILIFNSLEFKFILE